MSLTKRSKKLARLRLKPLTKRRRKLPLENLRLFFFKISCLSESGPLLLKKDRLLKIELKIFTFIRDPQSSSTLSWLQMWIRMNLSQRIPIRSILNIILFIHFFLKERNSSKIPILTENIQPSSDTEEV